MVTVSKPPDVSNFAGSTPTSFGRVKYFVKQYNAIRLIIYTYTFRQLSCQAVAVVRLLRFVEGDGGVSLQSG